METDLIEQAMVTAWGKRCPDFDFTCACCQAWLQFDKLVGGKDDRSYRSGHCRGAAFGNWDMGTAFTLGFEAGMKRIMHIRDPKDCGFAPDISEARAAYLLEATPQPDPRDAVVEAATNLIMAYDDPDGPAFVKMGELRAALAQLALANSEGGA